jgi:mannose-6-phosphate isomerase-like protein (cupin superfamily)
LIRLDQRVLRIRPGRSQSQVDDGLEELLYVISGTGTLSLVVRGDSHVTVTAPLEAETAALLLPGEQYALETDTGLEVVSVTGPAAAEPSRERVTLRLADRPRERADEHRTFQVLHESGMTQFVGVVQPSRAPDHSHPYDEVGTILEGNGHAHVGGRSNPLGPGSCFRLAPGEVHCIENTGPGPMRILGVFHPAGSPAQRS